MKESIKNKVDLLIANKENIEKQFKWGYSIMNIAAALVFTGAGKEADIERLKECKKILEKNTGALSSFQANSAAVIVSKMALSDNPEQYIKNVKAIYDVLNKKHVIDNPYLIQGAICIYEAGRMNDTEMLAAKYRELYKKMEKKHPILTSSEDIIYVVLLAMTDKDVDTIFNEIEDCYEYLKKDVKLKVGNNELQGLGEILALTDGNIREKCDKVVNLYNTILAHGVKWGKEYNEFGSLGTLIDINADNDVLVNEIVEVSDYLKSCKGFGGWSLDTKQRQMFSAMLVGDSYSGNGSLMGSSAVNSTVAMVIAEEVALMICIMACASAASSASH